jgi:hypothetical protein
MVQVLQLVIIALMIYVFQCDYPDFRHMNSRTDYDLVGNVTNFEQYKVESICYFGICKI